MRLERRGVAKMGAKAFTLTRLTPAEVAARPRHRFGAQAAAIQGCTFRRDDKLFTVHNVHIRPGSKTEHAVYARNMPRALARDEQKGPLEAVCEIFDPSEVLHRVCAFDRDQLPVNMRVQVPLTATAGQPPPPPRQPPPTPLRSPQQRTPQLPRPLERAPRQMTFDQPSQLARPLFSPHPQPRQPVPPQTGHI